MPVFPHVDWAACIPILRASPAPQQPTPSTQQPPHVVRHAPRPLESRRPRTGEVHGGKVGVRRLRESRDDEEEEEDVASTPVERHPPLPGSTHECVLAVLRVHRRARSVLWSGITCVRLRGEAEPRFDRLKQLVRVRRAVQRGDARPVVVVGILGGPTGDSAMPGSDPRARALEDPPETRRCPDRARGHGPRGRSG